MKKGIIIVLLAGGIWWLSRQAARVDIGSASFSRLKLEKGGIRVNVKIPVLNRSDFPAMLDGFLGSLQYKGNILGNITLIKPIEIARRSPSEPEFTTYISLGSLAGEIWAFFQEKLLKTGASPLSAVDVKSFRVVGTLYVSGFSVDINEPLVD